MKNITFDYLPHQKGVYITVIKGTTDHGVYYLMEDEDSITGRWICEYHTNPYAEWWDTGEDVPVLSGSEEDDVLAEQAARRHHEQIISGIKT